jgi:hypothetical protein
VGSVWVGEVAPGGVAGAVDVRALAVDGEDVVVDVGAASSVCSPPAAQMSFTTNSGMAWSPSPHGQLASSSNTMSREMWMRYDTGSNTL